MTTTKYTPTHLWVRANDQTATLGLTDYGQQTLGDITLVTLPDPNTTISAGDPLVTIEGTDGPVTFPAPLSGIVSDVNDDLANNPELINEDPLGDGWLVFIKLEDSSELDDLMDTTAYDDRLSNSSFL